MDDSARPSIEALLAHANWVRRLARSLVADPGTAEDLVQDTFVAALRSPPAERRGIASWLATTLHNVRRAQQRRELVRLQVESRGARAEHVASTEELAEQADQQRALVEHVLALEEPHRRTLLLRYFAELEPREIAKREKIALATVTSRLTRAHAKLRERLDRAHRGRREWLCALAPLVQRPEPISTLTLGGILVNAKVIVSSAVVLLIALLAAREWRSSGAAAKRAGGELSLVNAPMASTAASGELRAIETPAEEARLPVSSAPTPPTASGALPARTTEHVRGRALGADGAPVAGLSVGWSGVKDGRVKSSSSGTFELEISADQGQIDVADEAWITVRSGAWRAHSSLQPVVIAARALDLAGIVQDEQGRPLSGARVGLILPSGFDARFDASLEATTFHGWRTTSGADGRFALPRTPAIDGALLGAVLEGFAAAEIVEPWMADAGIVITLARPKVSLVGALSGRVVDDHELPVAAARVFLGLASTTSDAEGRFGITLAQAVSSDRIIAIKAGFRPAVMDRPGRPHGEETGWPERIELRLPGPVLAIQGIVVDPKDHPLSGVRVWIADPTPAGAIGKMPAFAENLMAGAPVPPEALASEAHGPKNDGDNFNDFYMPVGPSTAFWHWVLTDAEGRFELRGLDQRRYRLRLMDPKSLFATTTDGIEAGSDGVRVRMPAADLIPKVAGRLFDDDDRPLAGVHVALDGEAVGVRSRVFGGRVYVSMRQARESTDSDAEGRFEFWGVPRTGIQLMLSSEHSMPAEIDVTALVDPAACTIHVHLRCPIEVVVTSNDLLADAVAARDGDGHKLDLWRIDQEATNAYTDIALVDGHSGVVFTSSAARTILLLKDGVVVRTSPVRLSSTGPNRIEF